MSSYYVKQKMSNGVYRITTTKPKISLKEDFTADLLDDKNITMLNFNEKEFVLRYDQNINCMLSFIAKMPA